MKQTEFIQWIRDQVREWVAHDVTETSTVEAVVIGIQGNTVRLKVSTENQARAQYAPTLSPYEPNLGDSVLAMRTTSGLIVLNKIQR